MTYQVYKDAINELASISTELEMIYEENGGETSEYTDKQEEVKEKLKAVLTNEGADFLGRWLLEKQDEMDMWYAEKAAADTRIKGCTRSIDYVKSEIGRLMNTLGESKIKGKFYSFAPATYVSNKADTARINELYKERAVKALRDAGIPEYITITLGGSISAVPAGEETPDVFITSERISCRFTKPRTPKE